MLRVEVHPDLLRWARDRSGFSMDTLTRRFPKLDAWENRKALPTLKQLEDFAKATHTPIGFLFLQVPPVERVPIPDFRTVASARMERPSPDLLDIIYLCQQRQDWYRNYALAMGDEPRDFVGSAKCTANVVATAQEIRDRLALDLDGRKRTATWEEALRQLLEQVDAIGVLVMVSGVVASNNTRKLDPEEFRGFALCDDLAPLIFVNGADSKAAQMFTVAHELAHIWLGETAVSDAEASTVPEHAVERWCNQVAAELLVPLAAMRAEYDRTASLEDETKRLARVFKVSTLVILRRIFDAGGLSREAFWRAYRAELLRLRVMNKGSGGDFYLTLGARVGKTLARAIVTSALEGRTSFTEAFRLLGFKKMSTFDELGKQLGVVI